MGLGVVGGIKSRVFSRWRSLDPLDLNFMSLAIHVNDMLTMGRSLVDPPGLIHTINKAQTETDKELILNLVKKYIRYPRTIILIVVIAKNDNANQITLDHCRKIDEQGRRTLGIITKPDFLREGTDNELTWIELAQNKDIYLDRGWHMLKNHDDDQMDFSLEQRNAHDHISFSKGRYAELSREYEKDILTQKVARPPKPHIHFQTPCVLLSYLS
jgi:hypothetical protein